MLKEVEEVVKTTVLYYMGVISMRSITKDEFEEMRTQCDEILGHDPFLLRFGDSINVVRLRQYPAWDCSVETISLAEFQADPFKWAWLGRLTLRGEWMIRDLMIRRAKQEGIREPFLYYTIDWKIGWLDFAGVEFIHGELTQSDIECYVARLGDKFISYSFGHLWLDGVRDPWSIPMFKGEGNGFEPMPKCFYEIQGISTLENGFCTRHFRSVKFLSAQHFPENLVKRNNSAGITMIPIIEYNEIWIWRRPLYPEGGDYFNSDVVHPDEIIAATDFIQAPEKWVDPSEIDESSLRWLKGWIE